MKGPTRPSFSYLQLRAFKIRGLIDMVLYIGLRESHPHVVAGATVCSLPGLRQPLFAQPMLLRRPAEIRVGTSCRTALITRTPILLPPAFAVRTEQLLQFGVERLPQFFRNHIAAMESWWDSEAWRRGLEHGSLALHGFWIVVVSMVAVAEVGCSCIIAHNQTFASSVRM